MVQKRGDSLLFPNELTLLSYRSLGSQSPNQTDQLNPREYLLKTESGPDFTPSEPASSGMRFGDLYFPNNF